MKRFVEIKVGKNIKLTDLGIKATKIHKVWTIYDEDQMWEDQQLVRSGDVCKDDIEHIIPQHFKGAFFEEFIHDWDYDPEQGLFHYYSKLIGAGKIVKVLIEYDE